MKVTFDVFDDGILLLELRFTRYDQLLAELKRGREETGFRWRVVRVQGSLPSFNEQMRQAFVTAATRA